MGGVVARVLPAGLFTLPFMAHAWLAVTAIAITAGMVGTFVNLRGASFVAHAIPQASFVGAAAAYAIGAPSILGLAAGSGAVALALTLLERGRGSAVATALLLVTSLALGDLLVTVSNAYAPAVYSLLFGQLAGVSAGDLVAIAALSVATWVAVALVYRPLLYATVAPQNAEARGVPMPVVRAVFITLIVVSAALTVPVVGALLAFSLLVAPAAAARRLARTPGQAMAWGVGIALAVSWLAILLSFDTNWPMGFLVTSLGLVAYAGTRLATGRTGGRRAVPHAVAADAPDLAAAPGGS